MSAAQSDCQADHVEGEGVAAGSRWQGWLSSVDPGRMVIFSDEMPTVPMTPSVLLPPDQRQAHIQISWGAGVAQLGSSG